MVATRTNQSLPLSLLLAVISSVLCGCAVTYKPINTNSAFWENREKTIAAIAAAVPEPSAIMLGNQGLLDVAINSANARDMSEKLEKLDIKRASEIHINLTQRLEARGFKVKSFEDLVDLKKLIEFSPSSSPELFSPYDFRSYKNDGYDYVLFINVLHVGTQRSYYGFIPLGAPSARFSAVGYLVDTSDNKLIWYGSEISALPITDPWDQSPDFPNLLGAVRKNMDEGASRLERNLFAQDRKDLASPASTVSFPQENRTLSKPEPSQQKLVGTATTSIKNPETAKGDERQLTFEEIGAHLSFFGQMNTVTSNGKSIRMDVRRDGSIYASDLDRGIHSTGFYKINSTNNQVCISIYGRYQPIHSDCYRLFSTGANRFALRSASDNFSISYSK